MISWGLNYSCHWRENNKKQANKKNKCIVCYIVISKREYCFKDSLGSSLEKLMEILSEKEILAVKQKENPSV